MGKKICVLVLSLALVVLNLANAEVPAVFILGDSTADAGTNNFLPGSSFRADFPPYGIDFPFSRPTGRFSNGFNSADFLAKLIGFKRSPLPFFTLLNNTKSIKRPSFRGVNFASAGSGILNTTGQGPNGQRNAIPLGEQIEQFSTIYSLLLTNKGQACAEALLSKSLFFISIGSNDIFGYYSSKGGVPKEEFIATIGAAYENYLMNLYKLGARKFGIISVPPIGCCPFQRFQNTTGGCLEGLNDLARDFHSTIKAILIKLSSDYTDMKYSFGNAYEMTINVIDNPIPFGFNDVKNACCGDVKTFCGPNATVCSNRKEYLFWDLFHPTQKAAWLAAATLFTGEPRFVAPINFKQLAEA
ncbi:GDSL esterase/lipase At5g55050 [Ricinus communis]|uniref:Zinc finger protein, putative n=1 Tax=Ricinus communis TaxID=3988 RepID=B9SR03_RICCO|nr:GDSL esterase/lipase At5g55050 [Ricinus communis]EEF33964.1 zinc finger protein, putative [Ricinus communis]|eukprot:XP_002528422.1 GDSL esterase/lipase At5g55050 [Ricinus communis]